MISPTPSFLTERSMDFFEMMLPVYVDYLGCFEEGVDGVETPADVMRELHQRGYQENRFLPGGELVVEDDLLVLRDSPQRVSPNLLVYNFNFRHYSNLDGG